jgi:hypothetical protein
MYKAELGSRQRKDVESLPQLGQEIRKLVQYAYHGIAPDGIEELAIESSVKNSQIKSSEKVYIKLSRPP